jgi:hypothetical protein
MGLYCVPVAYWVNGGFCDSLARAASALRAL